MRRCVIIQQQTAWTNSAAREAQDLCLALAAAEHQVTVLYRGAAVTQLLPLAEPLAVKDFTVTQKLFALYDIACVAVCQQAMADFKLTSAQLRLKAEVLDTAAQRTLLDQADFVVVI
jgi:tRNA 2-thiouridine synthesizing protein C